MGVLVPPPRSQSGLKEVPYLSLPGRQQGLISLYLHFRAETGILKHSSCIRILWGFGFTLLFVACGEGNILRF